MSSMTTFHVSHVVGGSLSGPPSTTYRRVTATTAGAAIDQVSKELGNPSDGVWTAQAAVVEPDVEVYPRRLAA